MICIKKENYFYRPLFIFFAALTLMDNIGQPEAKIDF